MKPLKPLTLIEVVIALAILAMGLVAALSLTSLAKKRVDKAYKHWRKQHVVSQAAEYFLLTGNESNIPTEFFPYDNINAYCSTYEAENLQEDVKSEYGNWSLVTFSIRVESDDGKINETINVDKIVRNEDNK